MTDHSSESRRRRRRSGRHQQPVRRRASPPLPPDEARRNRDAAFGTTSEKRTWLTSTPAPAPAEPRSPEPPSPEPVEPFPASQPPRSTGSTRPSPPIRREPRQPQPSSAADTTSPDETGQRARGRRAAFPLEELSQSPADGPQPPPVIPDAVSRGRRRAALPAETSDEHDVWSPRSTGSPDSPAPLRAEPAEDASSAPTPALGGDSGSLPKVAFWTVLTTLLPGTGLLTTRLRRVGWLLLVILLLALAGAGAFLLIGDPLRNGMMLATQRGVLIGAMIAVGVVGLVWALQIVLANLAHSTQERLRGAKKYLALGLAALMVTAVLVPATGGVRSLWSLQGLVGSRSVFGGGEGGDHPFSDGEDPWAGAGRINILLLGQDAGADRTGTRPDTIMVASIDAASGRTALFSIPRNLEKVEFPEDTPPAEVFPNGFDYFGADQSLINAVWTWAEDRPDLFPNDPEPGLTVTTWAVEETLGLDIDYYAMVNLQGFEDLVNALGGVEMVVERRIPIGGGASKVEGYIEPGLQTLDGFHALWYARSREGSNDFDRMCRQQRIVRAVAEEANPTTLAFSIPGLVSATEQNIETDIPVKNLDAFVELALRIKDAGFTSYPITQDVTFSGNPDYEYLEKWVQASIEDSMKQEAPESVLGETEPGSTAPAETGAAPDQETASGEESADADQPTAEETPTEEPTEEKSSTPSGSTDATDATEDATPAPTIEQDPLKSCLPGNPK